jgi:hypothetical protein
MIINDELIMRRPACAGRTELDMSTLLNGAVRRVTIIQPPMAKPVLVVIDESELYDEVVFEKLEQFMRNRKQHARSNGAFRMATESSAGEDAQGGISSRYFRAFS